MEPHDARLLCEIEPRTSPDVTVTILCTTHCDAWTVTHQHDHTILKMRPEAQVLSKMPRLRKHMSSVASVAESNKVCVMYFCSRSISSGVRLQGWASLVVLTALTLMKLLII
jgi:hypothetical protein